MLKVIVIFLAVGVIYVGYDQLVALYEGDVSGREAISGIRERITDKVSANSENANTSYNESQSTRDVGSEGKVLDSYKSTQRQNEAEKMAERLLEK
jgi:hypothetical protein